MQSDNDKYFLTKPISKKEMSSLMLNILEEEFHRPDELISPEITKQYLHLKLVRLGHEVFSLIYLDSKHQVLNNEELFRGTLDGASVYPREVVKSCLSQNAAAVIFVHAYPSGIAEPSREDIHITIKLKQALEFVDVLCLIIWS